MAKCSNQSNHNVEKASISLVSTPTVNLDWIICRSSCEFHLAGLFFSSTVVFFRALLDTRINTVPLPLCWLFHSCVLSLILPLHHEGWWIDNFWCRAFVCDSFTFHGSSVYALVDWLLSWFITCVKYILRSRIVFLCLNCNVQHGGNAHNYSNELIDRYFNQ